MEYKNPKIVAVMCQQVYIPGGGSGYLTITRNTAPHVGQQAFPGGWVEYDETIEETAKRELLEEVGLVVNPPRILWSMKAQSDLVLVFCQSVDPVNFDQLQRNFTPTREASMIHMARGLDPLCFPTHQETLRRLMGYRP